MVMLAVSLFVLLLTAAAIWTTYKQIQANQASYAARTRAMTRNLAREQELDPRYQAALQAEHRRKMEIAKFQLEAELKLHYIAADTYVLNKEVSSVTAFPSLKRPVEAPPQITGPQLYPQAPPFASIKPYIKPGKLILGYTTAGPIHGDVTDLLSMLFAGKPGTGKSTALLYYLSMLLLVDAQVYVFDHQGSLSELSGLMPYFGNFKEFGDPMPTIRKEIKEREELWRDSKQVRKPMLILADELPAVARYEEKNGVRYGLLELAEDIVLEYRKYQVYCLLSGQSFPADILPTITRDNCSSRLLFNSSPDHARMAGLDQESRKKMLPLLKSAPQGTAILDVTRRPEPDIVAIPYTTVEDARGALGTFAQPHGKWTQDGFGDERDVQAIDANRPENGENRDWPANVRTFPKSGINVHGDEPDATSDERPKEYRLADEEIPPFVAAYRACGNIDTALASVGRGARFRNHARQIVNALGLRRDA